MTFTIEWPAVQHTFYCMCIFIDSIFFLNRLSGLYFTYLIVSLPLERYNSKNKLFICCLNPISFNSFRYSYVYPIFLQTIYQQYNVTGTYRIGCDWKIINNHFSTATIICSVFSTLLFRKLSKSIPMGKTNLFPQFRIYIFRTKWKTWAEQNVSRARFTILPS